MRCPSCDAFIKRGDTVCDECGAPVGPQPPDEASALDRYTRQIEAERARRGDPWAETDALLDETSPGGSGVTGSEAGIGTGADGRAKPLQRAAAEDIRLEAEPFEVLNLLLLHAGFSPLRRLAVRSASPDGLAGTRLRLTASPPVLQPLAVPLADLGGGGDLEPPVASADHAAFFRLDEAVRGQLDLALAYEGTTLVERSFPVTVQPGNEWIAVEGVEAALAGAVTPNAPAVAELVSGIRWDFTGYQALDPQRMVREVSEVYGAVRRLDLHYVGVPPSFEGTGQKVLFPDEVVAQKRGCCVDIAVLTASILERVGYNPLVVVVDGHAFSGVWTSDIRAKAPVIRDREAVRQAVAGGDLLVWNSTTTFDRQGDDSIGAAVAAGSKMLDSFLYAIDVAACRDHRLKPVPRRSA